MVHVYYHYANGYSRYGARCKHFATRRDADRWIYFVGRKYPTFTLDEIYTDEPKLFNENKGQIRL